MYRQGSAGIAPARPVTLLAWCAVASFGLLFVRASAQLDVATSSRYLGFPTGVAAYLPLAAPLLALVAWHLAPRRSWAWLLVAGAVCAVPLTIVQLAPGVYSPWMGVPLGVLTGCAPAFSIVGVLGAATVVWQAGARAVGAALAGTALVIQLVGPVIIASIAGVTSLFFQSRTLPVVGLIVEILALAGAIVAVIGTSRDATEPAVRPAWRVTLAGGLAAAAPAVAYLFQPDVRTPTSARGAAGLLGDYYLYIGLAFLAIGLIAGAVTGGRALIGSAATGLMLGPFAMLITPSAEVLQEMAVLAVVAAVASVLVGLVAGLSRWRLRIGTAGLGLVVLGLIVLSFLFNSDMDVDSYEGFTRAATPVLLVIGIIAAVAALSSLGAEYAATSETPAVLAGLSTPFAVGAITLIAHFTVHTPQDRAPIAGLLPPTAVALLVAAGLLGVLAAMARGTGRPDTPPAEPHLEPAGLR